ncbi:MAG: DUF554 family protein [Candidatus Limnocylindria bacterium]
MFLTGTLLNVATVLAGTVIGLLLGARMPARMQEGLAIKSLLDGVASIAFAAALGVGIGLSALTVLVVQGSIAGAAFLLRDVMDAATVLAITSAGGVILLGVALRLLDLKAVRVASFLPALRLAPSSSDWPIWCGSFSSGPGPARGSCPRLQRLSDLWRANVQHDVTLTH